MFKALLVLLTETDIIVNYRVIRKGKGFIQVLLALFIYVNISKAKMTRSEYGFTQALLALRSNGFLYHNRCVIVCIIRLVLCNTM